MSEWKPTACILCTSNCGIEIQLGGEDNREFALIRGDKKHPISKGYVCQKPQRLNYYQNNNSRVTAPLRRRDDGTYEEIDWDTAIREVAEKLAAVRDTHGGDKIFYYGGGGQGNHLPVAHSGATQNVLGVKYRSNALAQEKTGEFWVNGKMLGAFVHGDFHECEVAIFIGKNPWQSHGLARARLTVRDIARDDKRALIVIDPCRTETAEIADYHLAVRPGRDAWLLTALLGTIVQDGLADQKWMDVHTSDHEEIVEMLQTVPVERYAEISGIDVATIRSVAKRIAEAESVAVYEDLGVQQNRHSTLVSYLNRLIWVLTGNFGKKGAQNMPASFVSLTGDQAQPSDKPREIPRSPVAGARIITGLVPCSVIPEEILTDHPDRYRAMIVESSNPAHSLPDSKRMKEALEALDFLVVIDVAMTETARLADYVLPTPTQYEKYEATFFNLEFPQNGFHLRRPLLDAPEGVLTEPEIHARLVEALGAMPEAAVGRLNDALAKGRLQFGIQFLQEMQNPEVSAVFSVVLYRTLGPTLPEGAAAAAVLWGAAQRCFMTYPESVRRAGFANGDELFNAILDSPSGVIFSVDDYDESWKRIRIAGGKINAGVPELYDELKQLATEAPLGPTGDYPFLLSAGERRSFTANTIFRNPQWRKKDRAGSLRINPGDAANLGLSEGDLARVSTRGGAAVTPVEISDRMQSGHVSLPNGLGLDYSGIDLEANPIGVAPNDLTSLDERDWFAGTPWHKSVPANVEAV
ncbi:MAG: molybdopterin oxidoreductase family protein [Chloroflexi bacterium]|nr:MAG: molybdopterin oxidoreductase family protein [Chloroflexota bacterium]